MIPFQGGYSSAREETRACRRKPDEGYEVGKWTAPIDVTSQQYESDEKKKVIPGWQRRIVFPIRIRGRGSQRAHSEVRGRLGEANSRGTKAHRIHRDWGGIVMSQMGGVTRRRFLIAGGDRPEGGPMNAGH